MVCLHRVFSLRRKKTAGMAADKRLEEGKKKRNSKNGPCKEAESVQSADDNVCHVCKIPIVACQENTVMTG